jgi:hypothetical protein
MPDSVLAQTVKQGSKVNLSGVVVRIKGSTAWVQVEGQAVVCSLESLEIHDDDPGAKGRPLVEKKALSVGVRDSSGVKDS